MNNKLEWTKSVAFSHVVKCESITDKHRRPLTLTVDCSIDRISSPQDIVDLMDCAGRKDLIRSTLTLTTPRVTINSRVIAVERDRKKIALVVGGSSQFRLGQPSIHKLFTRVHSLRVWSYRWTKSSSSCLWLGNQPHPSFYQPHRLPLLLLFSFQTQLHTFHKSYLHHKLIVLNSPDTHQSSVFADSRLFLISYTQF